MTYTRTRTRPRPITTIRNSWSCLCKPKPYVIATFRNSDLVSVTRMHNRTDRNGVPQGCGLAPETLDVTEWGGRRCTA